MSSRPVRATAFWGTNSDGTPKIDPIQHLLADMKTSIEANDGRWTSSQIRGNEDPSSAAIHFVVGGKRYVGILQPLDMMDRGIG